MPILTSKINCLMSNPKDARKFVRNAIRDTILTKTINVSNYLLTVNKQIMRQRNARNAQKDANWKKENAINNDPIY